MALTFVLVRSTNYSLAYAVSQGGGAGDSLVIPNATLLTDANLEPIQSVLSRPVSAVDGGVEARELLFSAGTSPNPVTPDNLPRCRATIFENLMTGTQLNWLLSASNAGGVANLTVDTVRSAGATGTAVIEIAVQHTIDQ